MMYMTASIIPQATLQPMAATSNWRTPAFPSATVNPAVRVAVSTMIRPNRISPNRLAESRYLGTKRFIFSSPRPRVSLTPAGNVYRPPSHKLIGKSCEILNRPEWRTLLHSGGRYLVSNFFFAVASSLSLSSPTSGYSKSRSASVSITAAATTTRVNHLLSAGTTYHGAAFVAVS